VLEAGQRFRIVNQLRVPLGIATYAGPLVALPFGASAHVAVGIVVAARVAYWVAHFFVLNGVAPGIARPHAATRVALRELASVGGWITVSNIVSPIIVQSDRFAVATLFPIAASGWYGSAAEVATKQWLFTAALPPVLFSALSAARQRPHRRERRSSWSARRVSRCSRSCRPRFSWWRSPSLDCGRGLGPRIRRTPAPFSDGSRSPSM
jgi:O-antigen/teichoic acid export membrane protein